MKHFATTRRWLFAALLLAGAAQAQQNVDISGKEFTSGASDAKLAALGHDAALSGKRLVITAPEYWHAKIAARIHAGGEAKVVMRDGFFENIVVRVETQAPAPIKVTPSRTELASKPRATPARVKRSVSVKPSESTASVAPEKAAPKPAVMTAGESIPTPAIAPKASANSSTTTADTETIRQRLRTNLNHGRAAEGTMRAAQLVPGDLVFVDGSVRAVVRREGLNPQLYWLEGELDLGRAELKPTGANRYQVLETLRPGDYSLREARPAAPRNFTASLPPDGAALRSSLQKRYNDGRRIDEVLIPASLRHGDLIYTGSAAAVVVRRNGATLQRYWLNGSIGLDQSGLQKEGSNKYRVVGALH